MKTVLRGSAARPAVAVVGAWDPLVPAHEDLFRSLRVFAQEALLISLVVVLHPHPAKFLHRSAEWSAFDDLQTRLAIIRSCGVDAAIIVRFTRRDLNAGARELFDVLRSHVHLEELWLGAFQSLGVGPNGSHQAIHEITQRDGIRMQLLPLSRSALCSGEARRFLSEGHLTAAIRIVGRPPVWSRPKTNELRLGWRPGPYWAVPLAEPTAQPERNPIRVELVARGSGCPTLVWPSRDIRWLAFIRGPSDNDPES
jgi:FAD synthase